jgi:hypothetical protein
MTNRMKNRSFWSFMSAGTDGKKQKLYFEICPCVAFRGVTLGRKRNTWFRGTEYLIMYRNDLAKKQNIFFDWVSESQIYFDYE